MCVLILSHKPESYDIRKGCNVDTYQSDIKAKFCTTGEEAINHVAFLNGWNEPGATEYLHWFIYPDAECPYDEKDAETGEIRYKIHCHPMSQVEIDLEEDCDHGIPDYLRGPIEAKEEEFRIQAKEHREGVQGAEEDRRKQRQREDDERQLKYLKKRLGK